ncbi:riboflavin synthase [Halanaerobium hydrogeniformans]|uniref:Riboflavin synthase n=1 Tax=Halanaerobium hydrogeniformans TaxID=656519 RepID=E4RMQ2_HALHG|nr:riboflavin synthase [Halanaerobium hydrogeniformans]ADQ14583.1 riboflavin synthase, alpha subunit [Halanaerobium hydrogeniformans]
MFTGIIQEKGEFIRRNKGDNKYQLEIAAETVLKNVKTGDSIAVNGVCLTVVDFSDNYFRADVMLETLKATNLVQLAGGDKVNLEQALQPNSFIGGHFVTGHIDDTAEIKKVVTEKNAKIITMEVTAEVEKYIVKKGSAAINGVSLTVMEIEDNLLTISLIPETWSETNLADLSVGDKVNIETDMLGKYIYKMLNREQSKNAKSKISKEFLAENGFI